MNPALGRRRHDAARQCPSFIVTTSRNNNTKNYAVRRQITRFILYLKNWEIGSVLIQELFLYYDLQYYDKKRGLILSPCGSGENFAESFEYLPS